MAIQASGHLSWRAQRCVLAAVSPLYLSACSSSPSRNILGSYFPSWMICALLGLMMTIVVRALFTRAGIDGELPAPFMVYLCVFIASTFAIWLVWLA